MQKLAQVSPREPIPGESRCDPHRERSIMPDRPRERRTQLIGDLIDPTSGRELLSAAQGLVELLGEGVVKGLEGASEIFMTLVSEGPAGLWKYIQEKIGDLKETVVEGIKSFLKEKIITAGIMWVIGLLNPASAFIKAAKAIYDIVMFFVTRGSQIMSLVDAIIDSMAAIAGGGFGVAAAAVEKALGKAVPVVIGFLASLLGLGGISEKIRTIIQKVQAPVNKAVDWVIQKATSLAKSAGKLLGIGKEKTTENKPDERTNEQKQADADHAIADGEKLLSDDSVSADKLKEALPNIKTAYRLRSLEAVVDETTDEGEVMHIHAEVNPKKDSKKKRKKYALPSEPGYQRHHILVDEAEAHPLIHEASTRAGYDINSKENFILLPSRGRDQPKAIEARRKEPSLPTHRGSHPQWTNHVFARVSEKHDILLKKYESLNVVPEKILYQTVKMLERQLEAELRSWWRSIRNQE